MQRKSIKNVLYPRYYNLNTETIPWDGTVNVQGDTNRRVIVQRRVCTIDNVCPVNTK